jgi:predicted transposase YdaD
MEIINAKDLDTNPTLSETIEPDNDLKNMLVEYVGEKIDPEDQNVTVEMIVETMAKEFPDFLLAIAEENWIRGYHQALADVEDGKKLVEEEEKKNAKQRTCKLCEETE